MAKTMIVLSLVVSIWLTKGFFKRSVEVPCMKDTVHTFLNPVNDFVNKHVFWAKFLQVTSSSMMDFSFFYLMYHWIRKVNTGRVVYSLMFFYILRSLS